MTLVDSFPDGAVDLYADAIAAASDAIRAGDVQEARDRLAPIAGERWAGAVRVTRTAAPGTVERRARDVTDATRAAVFVRDRFRCSLCGGRGLARCVLVALSDVFPELVPYDRHYGRGRIHPAYWVLALEADHTVPHARGGDGDASNLTAMHALCNTLKSAADLHDVAAGERIGDRPEWDGLITAYPALVHTGERHGQRHAAANYHRQWLRRFQLPPAPVAITS